MLRKGIPPHIHEQTASINLTITNNSRSGAEFEGTVTGATVETEDRLTPDQNPPRVNLMHTLAHSIGFRALMVLANAATGIMTARALHPEGRGELAAMLLWPQVLSGIAAFGVPTALVYCVRRHGEQKDDYVSAGVYLALLFSAIAIVAGVVAIPYALSQYSSKDVIWAQWLMISVVASLLLSIARGVLEGEGRFLQSNILLVAPHVLALLGLVLLLSFRQMGTRAASLAYTFAAIPPLLVACIGARGSQCLSPARLIQPARRLLSYGLRSYGGDLCGVLTGYIDQALVVTLLSPPEMGVYVVALNLSRTVNIAQQSICAIIFPQSVGLSAEAAILLNRRALQASIALSLTAGGLVSLFGSILLKLLYGKAYMASAGVLRILLLEVLLNGVAAVCAQVFMALNRPGIVTLQQICGLVLAVPMLAWLIPRYGLIGAGFGILGATTFRLILLLASFPLFLGTPAPGFLPNAEDRAWFLERLRHFWRARQLGTQR